MFTFTSNSVYTTSLIYVLSNNRQNLHTCTCKLLQNAKNYIKIIYMHRKQLLHLSGLIHCLYMYLYIIYIRYLLLIHDMHIHCIVLIVY